MRAGSVTVTVYYREKIESKSSQEKTVGMGREVPGMKLPLSFAQGIRKASTTQW